MLGKDDLKRAGQRVRKGSSSVSIDGSGQRIPKNKGAGQLHDADSDPSTSRFGWEADDVEVVEDGKDDDGESPAEDKGEEESGETKKYDDSQPRDETGKWTGDGGSASAPAQPSQHELKVNPRALHGHLNDTHGLTPFGSYGTVGRMGTPEHGQNVDMHDEAHRKGVALTGHTHPASMGKAEGTEVEATPWTPFWKKDYSTDQRVELAREGKAIPVKDPDTGEITDGRYPIDNTADLGNALQSYGRAADKEAVQAHIVRQAKRLGATDQLPADWPGSTQKAAGLRKFIDLLEPQDVTPELPYRVVKSEETPEARYTLGIAYPADRLDVHGEYTTADELEKAAWRFAKAGLRAPGIQHKNGTDGAGRVVESYIYRGPDWQMGDEVVKSGDWLIGVLWEPSTWDSIKKGALTGFSIQGYAKRES